MNSDCLITVGNNKRTIKVSDIEECEYITPAKYHIDNMNDFLYIKLKNGEELFIEDEIKIKK